LKTVTKKNNRQSEKQPATSAGRDPVIAYLGRILPTLSETFVIREIAALVRLGARVSLFSFLPPESLAVHPETQGLPLRVTTVLSPWRPIFWLAHCYFACFKPQRYWTCFWHYVARIKTTWRSRGRLFLYFLASPFAAWSLRRSQISHIHAHFANSPTSVALMASHLAALPFSFMAHAYDVFVDTLLMPEKLAAAKFVATCSYFNIDYLREHFSAARRARLEVIRYGIDPAAFPPRQLLAHDQPLLLGVGRLVETKGFHTLVEACARLREAGSDFSCWIIGDGPEAGRLNALVQTLNLSGSVRLLGKRLPAEVKTFYQQADILIMPSCVRDNDRDGIPNVLLEAMAMTIPVISTYVSGIPELVRHQETGLLVKPDDPGALAEAIQTLMVDPALARRYASQGRALVEKEFNIYHSAARLLQLFTGP
jgi:colanic acid/amylovoran biosynthesis glycosyltransferase